MQFRYVCIYDDFIHLKFARISFYIPDAYLTQGSTNLSCSDICINTVMHKTQGAVDPGMDKS